MLDWVFEAIVSWISRTVTQLMDAVSGLFLNALGTEMTAMEEYFPFVAKAFTIMQYMAWSILFLVTVWQLFRAFGGPVTEAENPWALLARSAICALLIGYAKPIFLFLLEIAKAPYTALMDLPMGSGDFTFAGVENSLKNGLSSFVAMSTVVGSLLIVILMISLGWNYFKLLLEVVERYVIVGILCYTSPLAYSMGGSKATNQVLKSWCRMVGAQLLLLVMNVWFLRAFNSSVGQYIGSGGALSTGKGSVFLWLFCALAFLKTAQRFDSYLATVGLNAAQSGTGLGMELLMTAKAVTGAGRGFRSAGSLFGGVGNAAGAVAGTGGFSGGFLDKYKGNSFVRDAVVQGGTRLGAGGAVGLIGRAFGGIAARNGATLTGNSISSVASRSSKMSGSIGGDIADRSLGNYMPNLKGSNLSETQITGGRIDTKSVGADGSKTSLSYFSTSQYEKPNGPHSVVTASDGSQWYQMASGRDAGSYFETPNFAGASEEAAQVGATFPGVHEGTTLRTVGNGVMEANSPEGNSSWYSSAYFDEPEAPHTTMRSADGVDWYAMQPNAVSPEFETGEQSVDYNQAQFRTFMPGYEQSVTEVNGTAIQDGHFEVRHENGSGTMFYDSTQYATPRGSYQSYEDMHGNQWYAIGGDAAVDRKPVYENGSPVYDDSKLRTENVPSVRYSSTPTKFSEPKTREIKEIKPPNLKR